MRLQQPQTRWTTRKGCAGCHGDVGLGEVGPALAGNSNLRDVCAIVARLRGNTQHMPQLVFADQDIATLATFIRESWGNNFGPVATTDLGGC